MVDNSRPNVIIISKCATLISNVNLSGQNMRITQKMILIVQTNRQAKSYNFITKTTCTYFHADVSGVLC